MIPAPDPWDRFGQQALAMVVCMPLAVAIQFAGGLMILDGGRVQPGAVAFVFLFGLAFGLVPSLLAAAALRSWRNVRRDPAILIGLLFALPLLAAGTILAADLPGNVFILASGAAIGVGATVSLLAAALTRRPGPALYSFFAGMLSTLAGMFLVYLYAEPAGGAAPIWAGGNQALAAVVGAAVYAWTEPRRRVHAPAVSA